MFYHADRSADAVQAKSLKFQSWGHRPQSKANKNEGSLKGFHPPVDGIEEGVPALQAGGLPVASDPWGDASGYRM